MNKDNIKNLVLKSIKELQKKEKFSDFPIPEIHIEYPEEKIHGDYSTNIAMIIGHQNKKNPIDIANKIQKEIEKQQEKFFERVEVAKPGFVNFFISKEYLQEQIKVILKQKDKFGRLRANSKQKINIEFISANPTGPLTLGNGRGGFCGDVLANILETAGFNVKREYYINDTGGQIKKLGHSVLGDEEAVYQGDYIKDLRKNIKGKNAEEVGDKSAKFILKNMIKPTTNKMKIKFDVWFSEKDLYRKKEIDKTLTLLKRKKLVYEKEKALWFKSSKFGDDKDRVLVKKDSEPTYFLSDIAYLNNKIKRGFKKMFFFWGADHFGYVDRIKAATKALGLNKTDIKIIIMQMVRLIKQGREVKMSKRTGTYITLDELIDEVGLDVARFFFLTKSFNTHLNFDLDIAKEQSDKNPVYYIQYAHVRICSILNQSIKQDKTKKIISGAEIGNLNLLDDQAELELIKKLVRFPEIIKDISEDNQVQRLPQYALELASSFHHFYRDCRVYQETEKELSYARLSLIVATKIILKNTLSLMGISAPDKM